MSRRIATRPRAPSRPPHVPTPDPNVPDCCTCGLRTDVPNQHHIDHYPTTSPDAAAFERRQLGEKEDA
jgi:hypothetical protein